MKPSYAGVAATLAFAVALGGTSYAVVQLPKNSVTSKHIKNESIKGKDVKDGALSSADFGAGQLPAGPAGPTGPTGPEGETGAAGSALAYARVAADGTLDPATSKGVVNVSIAGASLLCFELGFTPKSITATVEIYAFDHPNTAFGFVGGGVGSGGATCPGTTDAYTATTSSTNTLTRLPVFVVFN